MQTADTHLGNMPELVSGAFLALLTGNNNNNVAARKSNDPPALGTTILHGFVAELDATSGENTGTSNSFKY